MMNLNFDLFGDFAAVGHPGYADGSTEGGVGGDNRFQSTPTFPTDLKSIKSIKSIQSIKSIALSDFRYAGVVI